jgi:hypothetical protein
MGEDGWLKAAIQENTLVAVMDGLSQCELLCLHNGNACKGMADSWEFF